MRCSRNGCYAVVARAKRARPDVQRIRRDLWTSRGDLGLFPLPVCGGSICGRAYIKARTCSPHRPPSPIPRLRSRALTDTFAGIRPADVPGFVVAQFVGAMAATFLFRWLVPSLRKRRNASWYHGRKMRRNEDGFVRVCAQRRPITNGRSVVQSTRRFLEGAGNFRGNESWDECSPRSRHGNARNRDRSGGRIHRQTDAGTCGAGTGVGDDGMRRRMSICSRR